MGHWIIIAQWLLPDCRLESCTAAGKLLCRTRSDSRARTMCLLQDDEIVRGSPSLKVEGDVCGCSSVRDCLALLQTKRRRPLKERSEKLESEYPRYRAQAHHCVMETSSSSFAAQMA